MDAIFLSIWEMEMGQHFWHLSISGILIFWRKNYDLKMYEVDEEDSASDVTELTMTFKEKKKVF